jgi:hypothetical protein
MQVPDDKVPSEEMRSEYDFSGGVRGKYYQAYQESEIVVCLDKPEMDQGAIAHENPNDIQEF